MHDFLMYVGGVEPPIQKIPDSVEDKIPSYAKLIWTFNLFNINTSILSLVL